jgi:hypothetical protein
MRAIRFSTRQQMYRSRAPVGGASLVAFVVWPRPSGNLREFRTPLHYRLVVAQSHSVGAGLIVESGWYLYI